MVISFLFVWIFFLAFEEGTASNDGRIFQRTKKRSPRTDDQPKKANGGTFGRASLM